jgi:DNA-binding transcriptional ArsR family regulator
MPDNDELELDQILAVLENPIRRKILMKLSGDTNYPLQLSKELNVSQQAIMKHLKVLEENDFVTSIEERSDKGGPPRKVYAPRRRYCIRIDIGPNSYSESYYTYRSYDARRRDDGFSILNPDISFEIAGKVTGEMKSEIVAALPAFTDPNLERMRMELDELIDQRDDRSKLDGLKKLSKEINEELRSIEKRRKSLLAIRERVNQESNQFVSRVSNDQIEKDILSILIKEGLRDPEILSERLDIRLIIIKEYLDRLLRL